MMLKSYISLLISLITLIIWVIKCKDYEWIYSHSSYLMWIVIIVMRLSDVQNNVIYITVINIVLLMICFIIEIVSISRYRKHHHLIDYEKRNNRRKKFLKILIILIPIMIFLKVLYEIEKILHFI